MKKILILLLMILSISLVACSDKYEKIYNLDNAIEIVEVLSEEEVKAYLEECDNVLKTLNYITYEGSCYQIQDSNESNSDSIKEFIGTKKGKLQIDGEIQFMFEIDSKSLTEDGEIVSEVHNKVYGKDEKVYIKYKDGEKFYYCGMFSKFYSLQYFCDQFYDLAGFTFTYRERRTYGIDKEGNFISYSKTKFNDTQDSIHIMVYNNHKLVYKEWRRIEGEQVVYCAKESFSYNRFPTIRENFEGYEHSDFCIASKHD